MIRLEVHRTESDGWLSNAYLVVSGEPGARRGVLIDGNGVPGPLLDRVAAERIEIEGVLLTHHHADHVAIDAYRTLGVPLIGHPATADLAGLPLDRTLADGELLELAGLRVEALHTPGHAADHIAYLIDGTDCFTADVLFRGTVGGTRAPAATGLADLRASLDRLLALPPTTRVHPGHREPTTVAQELATNPFVLALRGDEPPAAEPCTVGGEPAELLLWGPDYDGTHKAWVRLADGTEHITGGSQVQRGD